MLPWLLCGALALAVLALAVKLLMLHRDMERLAEDLSELLAMDTNALLSARGGDRYMRRLAAALNRELKLMQKARRRYESGNLELETAVAGISHDLRTPLTALCGYLSLVKKEDVSPEVRRYLAIISDRAEALKTLTEELFHFSVIVAREEDMALEPTDLRRALEAAVAAGYAMLCQRDITPVIHMPSKPVLCMANGTALARVLENILSNAAKYSPGDLTIVLSADGAMTFSNHAPGLDKIQVGRLFDRFYTVQTAGGSTGLGLSIARALAERMGGRIGAEYEDGKLIMQLTLTPGGS